MPDENLVKEFDRDMLNIFYLAKDVGYIPTRFLQMIEEIGGVETAKRLLSTQNYIQEGIVKLWKLGRLDLSIESLVIRIKYRTLFSEKEIETAKKG